MQINISWMRWNVFMSVFMGFLAACLNMSAHRVMLLLAMRACSLTVSRVGHAKHPHVENLY
jgi:hypothetical protein